MVRGELRTIGAQDRPEAPRARARSHRRPRGRRLAALLTVLAAVGGLLVLASASGVLDGAPGRGASGSGDAGLLDRASRILGGAGTPDSSSPPETAVASSRHTLQVGVVGSDAPQAPQLAGDLGARVMRSEFTASTTVEQLAPLVDRLAARGIRLQPLVGWDDGTPAPDLTPVARWAAAFGPGGTHWAGRSDATAITDIELGNENAFYYKSGLPDDDRYHDLATAYGQRSVEAARAVHAANPATGVLVELESADSERSTWIDDTLAAGGPDLIRLMHGPVIHPYGPDWREKLDRDVGFVRDRGVTTPFYLTEWGISSDDGPALSDNYDWPVDLTYDRAGSLLTTAIGEMAARPAAVRQVLLYQLADQRDPGTDTDREHYFGLVRGDGTDKGGYTAAVRAAYRRFP